jgi:putative transposase
MSLYQPSRLLPRSFRLILASFLGRPGLPFADVVTEASIQRAFEDEGASFAEGEDTVYTPAITLWAFLSQVLFKDAQRSCVAAVARVVVLVALEREPCSGNTGAYCRARAKLSEPVLRRLVNEVADGCEREVKAQWLWHGRHVYLVDGTTVSMPDTPDNQREYPQLGWQEKGLGFPIARLIVLLSLATGMLQDMALGPYTGKETGEPALLRPLLGEFQPGDILLADRYYCSYFMIALLIELGIDFVTRLHQGREIDFRRGRRLGRGDHIVEWVRPARPAWMDPQTYQRMPASIQVREVHVHVGHPGFRVESLVVVTTLTDADTYTREDIASLYGFRWLAELDIRAIKITMGMDILRCKTPAMVRKEMWTCLLAYNLIRRAMLQAAQGAGTSPRALSFCAALQAIAAGWQVLASSGDSVAAGLVAIELKNMAAYTIGNRPGRVEPRAVKRRPKPHKLLLKPRDQARAELMTAGSS